MIAINVVGFKVVDEINSIININIMFFINFFFIFKIIFKYYKHDF